MATPLESAGVNTKVVFACAGRHPMSRPSAYQRCWRVKANGLFTGSLANAPEIEMLNFEPLRLWTETHRSGESCMNSAKNDL